MIKKALLEALEQQIISAEELYNLDDQGLFTLMASKQRDFPAFSLALRVKEGNFYAESAFFYYNEEKHLGIKNRRAQEAALAEEIGRFTGKSLDSGSIIIDVPEPVSFETDLFVRDENCSFGESSSAFKKSTVEAFVKSLRTIRIFTAFPIDIPEGILQNCKKELY